MAVLLSAIPHGRESSHAGFCRTTFQWRAVTEETVNAAYELADLSDYSWKESPANPCSRSCFFTSDQPHRTHNPFEVVGWDNHETAKLKGRFADLRLLHNRIF